MADRHIGEFTGLGLWYGLNITERNTIAAERDRLAQEAGRQRHLKELQKCSARKQTIESIRSKVAACQSVAAAAEAPPCWTCVV